MLEVVHSFNKYSQYQDLFIMDFVDVLNLTKAELFCFYIDPFSNFNDPLCNDFTKFL
jgi:hypothetical protein